MTVHFDTDTGRLRLDQDAFQTLAAWAGGRSRKDPGLDDLRTAGVVRRGTPHPALVPGLDAVANPVCRLSLTMRDGAGRVESGEGWVNGGAAALLLDLPDGLREFVAVHPTFLPAALARIVQLGPRPRIDAEPLQVTTEMVDQLTDPDPARRQAAVASLAEAAPTAENAAGLRALGSGPRRRTVLTAHWQAPGGTAGVRGIHLLDTEAGLWLLEAGPVGGAVAWPTTPTAVWRAFVVLLPRDTELA